MMKIVRSTLMTSNNLPFDLPSFWVTIIDFKAIHPENKIWIGNDFIGSFIYN